MAKIQSTLELIRRELNSFYQNLDPRREDWVILSNLIDQDNRPIEAAADKVVMFLANIKHETSIATFKRTASAGTNNFNVSTPVIYIDLILLFYANFFGRNYPQGLAVISRTIAFFQQNPVFTHQSIPDLDLGIDKLTMELVNLEMLDLNHLMALTGVKYLPSVVYKLRMIPFGNDGIKGRVPSVGGVQAQ